jgi:hypothetical protein
MGNFSCGYEVVYEEGRKASLKALDYSQAFTAPDLPAFLQAATRASIFECDLLILIGIPDPDP